MSKQALYMAPLLLAILAACAMGATAAEPVVVETMVEESAGPDTQAPLLLTFDLRPQRVNTGIGPSQVLISAYLADAGSGVSGVGDVQVQFKSPSGTGSAATTFYHGEAGQPDALIAGDVYHGLWQVALELPQGAEEGTWDLDYLFLIDQAGNYQVLAAQDLQAFGFVSTIQVFNKAVSLYLPMARQSGPTPALQPTPWPTVTLDMPPLPPR